MELFKVNQKTCNQDGICSAVCPVGIIDFQKGEYPTPNAVAETVCIRCGHCVAVCPTGSLSHREMALEECPPIQKALYLTDEQCEQFLRSRRSIRVYKDKPVPREELERLIAVARYAPSGHNSQCAEWLVLSDSEALRNLTENITDWMRWMISNMPEIAVSLGMDGVLKQWEKGIDMILRDAPVVIVAHAEKENMMAPSTCTIALTYLELAAASMGLGCCWAGYFNAAATTFPPMMEALSLPEGHHCFGAMMVGYPKFSYHRLPTRKPPSVTWR
ncbi:MAG: nitroreductase family protein [Deltaproteobacteria bacterium]|nr:nitroreductase family protein [Deltaproteobacteria bacterium]